MTTKQFTSDLKLKAVNYYHKINNYVKPAELFAFPAKTLPISIIDVILNVQRCKYSPKKLICYYKILLPSKIILFFQNVQTKRVD